MNILNVYFGGSLGESEFKESTIPSLASFLQGYETWDEPDLEHISVVGEGLLVHTILGHVAAISHPNLPIFGLRRQALDNSTFDHFVSLVKEAQV
jgi:hypothetical protein